MTTLIFLPFMIGDSENTLMIRILVTLVMILIHDPLFTSNFCTLGQKITGIRVRDYNTHDKIDFLPALFRVFIKFLLGEISFFSILFSKEKRAIHDFAAKSIVMMKT